MVLGGKTTEHQCMITRDLERERYYPIFFSFSVHGNIFFSLFSVICRVSIVVGVKLALLEKPKISQTVASLLLSISAICFCTKKTR
jgi:hypothetical protein